MKPNDLGKAAGFTARDGQRLGKVERDLETARQLIAEWEAATGESCEQHELCSQLLETNRKLRERFFSPYEDPGPKEA